MCGGHRPRAAHRAPARDLPARACRPALPLPALERCPGRHRSRPRARTRCSRARCEGGGCTPTASRPARTGAERFRECVRHEKYLPVIASPRYTSRRFDRVAHGAAQTDARETLMLLARGIGKSVAEAAAGVAGLRDFASSGLREPQTSKTLIRRLRGLRPTCRGHAHPTARPSRHACFARGEGRRSD
jgi:hypothetical protein